MTFIVSAVAPDRRLVTQADVVAHLGVRIASTIPMLDTIIRQVSDLVSKECGVTRSGVSIPTLRQETIVETIRFSEDEASLILARRFVGAISSITENGTALDPAFYSVDKAAGLIQRLDSNGAEIDWSISPVVVTYTAGFSSVPEDLKLATIRAIHEQISASSRDPLLRSESVDGISRFDYWVNGASASSTSSLSPGVLAMLSDYRTICA
jgi:hypothetical protein